MTIQTKQKMARTRGKRPRRFGRLEENRLTDKRRKKINDLVREAIKRYKEPEQDDLMIYGNDSELVQLWILQDDHRRKKEVDQDHVWDESDEGHSLLKLLPSDTKVSYLFALFSNA